MTKLNASENSRISIVGVSTSYPVRHDSTAGLFVHRLYRELTSKFELKVVCPGDSSGNYIRINQGVKIIPVNYAPKKLRVLGSAGGIIPAIQSSPWKLVLLPLLLFGLFVSVLRRGRKADLIHANWAICGMLAGFAGWLLGKPVVTTLRGDDITRASQSLIDRIFLTFAIRCSRKIICVSESMAERLSLAFPDRKPDIHACLNGVDESFFSVKRIGETSSKYLRIVCVGSLIPRKAYDTLIRAVSICDERQSIHVRIIGDGPSRTELESLCLNQGVSDQFEFMGECNQEQIRHVFAQSDLFILPSRSEGRPNALVEAIASGLPAISTDLEGVRGLVFSDLNGWLFAVDKVDELATLVGLAFCRKSQLPVMGERGRAILSAQGGWSRTASCYAHIFTKILEREFF